MPSASAPTPATSRALPSTSGRTPPGSRVSRSRRRAGTSAASPIGTLTKNTQRQPSWSTSTPPSDGPSAAATAPVALQIATAVARRSGGNSGSSRAREVGTRIAPPAACSTRAATSRLRRGRHAAQHRRGDERGHSDQEHAPPADEVGEPPGRHEQRREHDVVGVQHPGQVGARGLGEVALDVGERDVHDRHVEEAHEDCDCGDGEDLPATFHRRPGLLSCLTQLTLACRLRTRE